VSTYTPIASTTLTSAATFVDITAIPQTYTDLVLVVSGKSAGSYFNSGVTFNGDTGSNYSYTYFGVTFPGNVATISSGVSANTTRILGAQFDNADNQFFIHNIMSYTNTNIKKCVLVKTYNSDGSAYGDSSLYSIATWNNTSAINSMRISTTTATNFAVGTKFNLYGIANASITNNAKAIGGDSVYRDSSHWYHVFNKSGTFTPTQTLTADYLVVAGGGGGGGKGGGGGAGGLRCTVGATGGGGSLPAKVSFTNATAYAITIGAGGIASTTTIAGGDGSSSSIIGSGFTTITTTGGGGGGTDFGSVKNGRSGGSGGGAAGGGYSPSGTGGSGTANEGYAGAGNTAAAPYNGGGGGGAGAAGSGSSTPGNATGGIGIQTSISGTATYYGGGGGGGWDSVNGGGGTNNAGGQGGGGTGTATTGVAGTANTGGGGGGGGYNGSTFIGAAGGSGIVIIRYPV